MGRGSVAFLFIAAVVCVQSGCSAPFRADSLPLLGGEPNSAADDESAFDAAVEHAIADEPADSEGEIQLAAGEAPQSAGVKRDAHDAATLRMIEDELKDATPQERDQLLADLRGLQPAMVRQILRMRQMVRQIGRDAPGAEAVAETADASEKALAELETAGVATVEPASDTEPAAEPAYVPARRGTGLGSVDPWSDRRTTGSSAAPAWGDGRRSFDGSLPADDARGAHQLSSKQWGASLAPAESEAAAPNQSAGHGHSAHYGPAPRTVIPAQAVAAAVGQETKRAPSSLQSTTYSGLLAPANRAATSAPSQAVGALGQMSAYGLPRNGGGVASNTANSVEAGLASYRDPADPLGPVAGTQPAAGSRWGDDLVRMIARAEADVSQMRLGESATEAERRDYIESHVFLRMLYLMAGQQERALTAIPDLDAADQEFWQQTLWAVANYFDSGAIPDAGDRASQTIAQLRSAIQRLQENARLELRNVTFCHKIASFGTYERFDRDEFTPGQPVLVYAEVANFKSEPSLDGQYRTLLRSTIEIHEAGSGQLVERMAFPATEDLCRNFRRDYFHSYEFTIPQRISLGPHVMKLIVEDQLSRKVATYTLNFTVR